jgi:RNA polymerase sigma factor (sigma-70 family)
MMNSDTLAEAVNNAKEGNQDALEMVVRGVQDKVYGLAVRMLGHPEDAADATQEILLKVITHLSQFRGESAFTTWVYRVAANHLLSTRASRREQRTSTFSQLGALLDTGLAYASEAHGDNPHEHALVEEMRIGCTQGMLLCLDRPQRLAFILGVVFQVSSEEGAAILETTPAAFRQRLARARRALRDFMEQRCGLVNSEAACRCSRQIAPALASGRLNESQLIYSQHPVLSAEETSSARQEIIALEQVASVFRSHPHYRAPGTFVTAVRELVRTSPMRVLR